MIYRRVQEESNELLCTVWSLVTVRELASGWETIYFQISVRVVCSTVAQVKSEKSAGMWDISTRPWSDESTPENLNFSLKGKDWSIETKLWKVSRNSTEIPPQANTRRFVSRIIYHPGFTFSMHFLAFEFQSWRSCTQDNFQPSRFGRGAGGWIRCVAKSSSFPLVISPPPPFPLSPANRLFLNWR